MSTNLSHHPALFHLITELKNQRQLLVTMQDIMKPRENGRLRQIPKLASSIPIQSSLMGVCLLQETSPDNVFVLQFLE